MSDELRLSTPYVTDGQPGRYGRDFHHPGAGAGRIEEAPPVGMDADANVVGRVVVRFFEQGEGPQALETVDTRDVVAVGVKAPSGVWEFRRQVIDEATMLEAVGNCVDHAMNADQA